MSTDSAPPIRPNLESMKSELLLSCKALGVAAESAAVKDIRAKAKTAGITNIVTCNDTISIPGQLMIDPQGDPQIAALAKQEKEAVEKAVKFKDEPSYQREAQQARRRYSDVVGEARSTFHLLLNTSGIMEVLGELQKEQMVQGTNTLPKMVRVTEKLNPGPAAASAPKR